MNLTMYFYESIPIYRFLSWPVFQKTFSLEILLVSVDVVYERLIKNIVHKMFTELQKDLVNI